MRSCEGCAIARLSSGSVVQRCGEIDDGCVFEAFAEEYPNANPHLIDEKVCEYERLAKMVQDAIENPPRIL